MALGGHEEAQGGGGVRIVLNIEQGAVRRITRGLHQDIVYPLQRGGGNHQRCGVVRTEDIGVPHGIERLLHLSRQLIQRWTQLLRDKFLVVVNGGVQA